MPRTKPDSWNFDRTRKSISCWGRRLALGTRKTTIRGVTLAVGAALSVGGVTDAFDGVQYLVQKDLDSVQVIRKSEDGERVVANLAGGAFGTSVFKAARMVPDRYIAQESSLFDLSWLDKPTVEKKEIDTLRVIHGEITLVNDRIRGEFFKTLPFGSLIHEKATKYGVDPALVAAVMEQESRFKPRARSPVGARGLMQLMPRTGKWMGAKDLYDPEQNVDAGAKYLKYLDKRFQGNRTKIIAAYNAGEGNVKRYNGIPPFRETRTYVKKVVSNYKRRNRELQKFEKDSLTESATAR